MRGSVFLCSVSIFSNSVQVRGWSPSDQIEPLILSASRRRPHVNAKDFGVGIQFWLEGVFESADRRVRRSRAAAWPKGHQPRPIRRCRRFRPRLNTHAATDQAPRSPLPKTRLILSRDGVPSKRNPLARPLTTSRADAPTATAPKPASTRTASMPTSSIPTMNAVMRKDEQRELHFHHSSSSFSLVAFFDSVGMELDREYHTREPRLETSGHIARAAPEEGSQEIHRRGRG